MGGQKANPAGYMPHVPRTHRRTREKTEKVARNQKKTSVHCFSSQGPSHTGPLLSSRWTSSKPHPGKNLAFTQSRHQSLNKGETGPSQCPTIRNPSFMYRCRVQRRRQPLTVHWPPSGHLPSQCLSPCWEAGQQLPRRPPVLQV